MAVATSSWEESVVLMRGVSRQGGLTSCFSAPEGSLQESQKLLWDGLGGWRVNLLLQLDLVLSRCVVWLAGHVGGRNVEIPRVGEEKGCSNSGIKGVGGIGKCVRVWTERV